MEKLNDSVGRKTKSSSISLKCFTRESGNWPFLRITSVFMLYNFVFPYIVILFFLILLKADSYFFDNIDNKKNLSLGKDWKKSLITLISETYISIAGVFIAWFVSSTRGCFIEDLISFCKNIFGE